jgi:hypothetical protein
MHPKVLEKYRENAYEIALERASDGNERRFFEGAKAAKQPVKHEITNIVRVRKGKEEYFYYIEELNSRNYIGNQIHHFRTVGIYEDPSFRNQVNPETGKKVATEILKTETVYEFEWPKDWAPELENQITENVDLLVITPGRKYGGFTYPEFKERSFDELVTISKFGTLNPGIPRELQKKQKTGKVKKIKMAKKKSKKTSDQGLRKRHAIH